MARSLTIDAAHGRFVDALRAMHATDGGFGFTEGAPAEPEPTAVAALALGDDSLHDALRRLELPRRAATRALASIALADADVLSSAVTIRATTIGEGGGENGGGEHGWGWTPGTYSWVEPTSWVLLATKKLRPRAADVITEAEELLAARQCDDGGWNYGNASTRGVDLRGYVQTTAVALIALQGRPRDVVSRGSAFLLERWPDEIGGLTLSQAVIAARLLRAPVDPMVEALAGAYERTRFLGGVLPLAWAVLATATDERLDALRVTSS